MLRNHKREEHAKILCQVAQICDVGGLKPAVDENQFSLEEVRKAHAHLESRKAIGKVVFEY